MAGTDLLVSQNNGPIQAFEARPHASNRLFRIKLIGRAGNVDCVGAKVSVEFSGTVGQQSAEVTAGGGYLSQSTPILAFGAGRERAVKARVRWPDGLETTHNVKKTQRALAIRWPAE